MNLTHFKNSAVKSCIFSREFGWFLAMPVQHFVNPRELSQNDFVHFTNIQMTVYSGQCLGRLYVINSGRYYWMRHC